ncbi:DUF6538 domain-containing protein [Oricola thermophila]|uniref:Integrase n=1 Tax=Oricola thermophila TaxID=2742145 RepID=A0A6N1VE38_9HYPH|nr:DUF6538 domain-containing protein [Oricola thermophila]QKV18958.1 integrase [Oricola thermophila]
MRAERPNESSGSVMATRHEVQNLVRRGHHFYWRPRIPALFRSARRSSHLSLSLRHSDHRKAAWMARRLNTLLHEMKLGPTAHMTTRDQLEALFRAEIDRMTDHLDSLVFAARRSGSDPRDSLRADLEVGWAYRLIQLYGTMRRPDFGESCPARAILLKEGIPENMIPTIAETFRQEQVACRSRAFEDALVEDMKRHGIEDTLVNREKAIMELMRAKADVLLDTAGRYLEPGVFPPSGIVPAVDENDQAQHMTDVAQAVQLPEHDPDEKFSAQSDDATETAEAIGSAAGEAKADRYKAPDLKPLPRHEGPANQTRDGIEGEICPVAQLNDLMERYAQSRAHEIDEGTLKDIRVAVRTFIGVLQEHGVEYTNEIRQFHAGKLCEHFNSVLADYGRSSRLRSLSPAELREATAKRKELAEARGERPPRIGLGPQTIRKHLGNLDGFLKHVRGKGYQMPEISFEGLRPRKPRQGDIRYMTDKPEPERLRPMFRIPIFTGCLGSEDQGTSGPYVFHCANYFVPMLLAYLGARREEIAGLSVDEVTETPNGWAIDIRPTALRRIKNMQSNRMLPVPDELIRLNFIDYVQAIRELGYEALFPELYSPHGTSRPGDRFYKDFVPAVLQSPEINNAKWKRFLHALRHGHANTLKQAGVHPGIIDDIAGRIAKGETSTRYTNAAGLPLIRQHLAVYPKITDHLEPQPIRLLPWVAERRAPPWAGKTPAQKLEHARKMRAKKREGGEIR